jgi:hypothetical protein
MASLKRVQNFISDAFSFVNQEPRRTPVLVMDALDETGDVAGTAIQKTATRCPHLALQPLPAGNHPTFSKPLKTGKKLVGHLQLVADMYMSRALRKLYNVHRAATVKTTEVLQL